MINWISVKDEMPPPYHDVIAYHSEIGWFTGYYANLAKFENPYWRDTENDTVYSVETVTHWAIINLPGE